MHSPLSTRMPDSRAARSSSMSRRVLPTPDSPATNAIEALPTRASARPASSSASSGCRPTKVVLDTRDATPEVSRRIPTPPPPRGERRAAGAGGGDPPPLVAGGVGPFIRRGEGADPFAGGAWGLLYFALPPRAP